VATIFSVFLGGLALGAALGGWLLDRKAASLTGQRVLLIYALVELLTGLYALLIPPLLNSPILPQLWLSLNQSGEQISSLPLRFLLCAIVLIVPTMAMGAGFPIVCRTLAANSGPAAGLAGKLYFVNVAGAVIGTFLAGFFLLESFGLGGSNLIAAGINVLIAAAIAILLMRQPVEQAVPVAETVSAQPGKARKQKGDKPLSKRILYSLAALSGATALIFEVASTRMFSLLAGSSIYSFTCVLGLCLAGLAAGSYLGKRLGELKQPLLILSMAYVVGGCYLIVVLYCANDLPWNYIFLLKSFLGGQAEIPFVLAVVARLLVVAAVVLVPSICLGTGVPLLFYGAQPDEKNLPATAGGIYAVNSLGAILGAGLSGFWLIPWLSEVCGSGIQMTLLIVSFAMLFLALACFICWATAIIDDAATSKLTSGLVAFMVLAVVADVAYFKPVWSRELMSCGPSFFSAADLTKLDREGFMRAVGVSDNLTAIVGQTNLLFYREGLNSTVTVAMSPSRNITYLRNDGKVEAAVPTDANYPSKGSDTPTHVLLAALPVLMHEGPSENSFVVGYGSGTTVGSLAAFKEIKAITVAELEPAVLAAGKCFAATGRLPTDNHAVDLKINDARCELAGSQRQYDVICSQPPDPWVNGSSQLFTREFFQLVKQHLKPKGLFCQWVQLYSLSPRYLGVVLRTFAGVFPQVVLCYPDGAGECLLVGASEEGALAGFAAQPVPIEIDSRLGEPKVAALMAQIGCRDIKSIRCLGKLYSGSVKKLFETLGNDSKDKRINTDDNLVLEFAAAHGALSQQNSIDANLAAIESQAKQ
jgi:spermidine synthase